MTLVLWVNPMQDVHDAADYTPVIDTRHPRGLFGNSGCNLARCLSSSQNSPAISRSR